MRIASVARALPRFRYSQEQIRAKLEEIWSDRPLVAARLATLHEHACVGTRHLALPLEEYGRQRTFGETNDEWIRVAQDLGQEAIEGALAAIGLGAKDIDTIFVVSVTGIASPSLDALLANRMGFRSDVKRVPIFGLGCVAGVAGISRAADYVKAYPDQVAVLLSVELCSLTFQSGATSIANAIAAGLFGDGAAAVAVVGEQRARRLGLGGLRVLDTRSTFYPDTEDVMGWRVSERGFDLVLSPAVPTIARERLAPDVDAFLAEHGLGRADITNWVCHPGGPKVLSAMRVGLGLSDEDVAHSWRSLADEGNISSTSVLLVLERVLAEGPPKPQGLGLMIAMGPAFCSELVLFEWCEGP